METLKPVLEEQSFLRGLEPRHLDLLVGCASNVRFHSDDYLIREGQAANLFYIIRSGHVSIETYSPGRGRIGIQTLGEGDVLGWSWLIPPFTWEFDARAMELTRALALDATCLRGKCDDDHDLGYEIMKRFSNVIVQRLRAAHLQLVDIREGAG